MFLGHNAFRFFMANIFAFVNYYFGGFSGWSEDDYKKRLGISESTIKDWIRQLESGTKKLNVFSITAICLATGIRERHIISKIINLRSYNYDSEMSRREFRTHVSKKFGLISQFGLDQLKE